MEIKGKFIRSLPYSSEIFGVYQPLLGWKSERTKIKFEANIQDERLKQFEKAIDQFQALAHYDLDLLNCSISVKEWKAGNVEIKENYGSLLLNKLAKEVKAFDESSNW